MGKWVRMVGVVAFVAMALLLPLSLTAAPTKKRWRIAIVPKALTGEYWVRCQRGAQAAAKQFGVELLFVGPSAETEVDKQIDIVENLLTRGVDAIGISPCDGKALVPTIDRAIEKGVPVITVDSDAPKSKRLSYIGTDNEKAGELAGQQLAKLMGGKGKVLIINGVPGAENLMQRIKGFKRAIAKFPQIRIVSEQACQSDQTLALNIAENALTAHPDLGGIFGVNARRAGRGAGGQSGGESGEGQNRRL